MVRGGGWVERVFFIGRLGVNFMVCREFIIDFFIEVKGFIFFVLLLGSSVKCAIWIFFILSFRWGFFW